MVALITKDFAAVPDEVARAGGAQPWGAKVSGAPRGRGLETGAAAIDGLHEIQSSMIFRVLHSPPLLTPIKTAEYNLKD